MKHSTKEGVEKSIAEDARQGCLFGSEKVEKGGWELYIKKSDYRVSHN